MPGPREDQATEEERRSALRHALAHPVLTEKGRATERTMLEILAEQSPEVLTAAVLEERLLNRIPRGKFRNLRYLRQSLIERLEAIYLSKPPLDGTVCIWIPDGRQRSGYQCRFRRWPVRDANGALVYKDRGELAQAFWRRLVSGELLGTVDEIEKVHIVFANELPERPVDRARLDRGVSSGTGEVIGAFLISRVCQELGLKTRLIRSSLAAELTVLNPDDKPPMVVFLGSSLAVKYLRQPQQQPALKLARRLLFGWRGDTDEGELRETSEQGVTKAYLQPSGDFPSRDYAAVSILPSIAGAPVVFAAGISSAGTEMAARFLCSNTNHGDRMRREGVFVTDADGRSRVRPFEIRFEVEVNYERPRILSADFVVRQELDSLLNGASRGVTPSDRQPIARTNDTAGVLLPSSLGRASKRPGTRRY